MTYISLISFDSSSISFERCNSLLISSLSKSTFLRLSNNVLKLHLIKFKEFIQWKNDIKFRESTQSVRISFRNKYFTEQLKKLGVSNNKSLILTYPKFISNDLQRHFIRGYFDGDGCIHFRKEVKKKSVLVNLLGTPMFLNEMRNFCPIKINKLYKNNKSDQTLVYQTTGIKAENFQTIERGLFAQHHFCHQYFFHFHHTNRSGCGSSGTRYRNALYESRSPNAFGGSDSRQ